MADKLADNASLVGWLYRSTRFAALNQLRDDRRRLAHERQAMEQLLSNSETAPDWDRIRPVLDEAMDNLKDEDRDALLLRYFKNHDFRDVGRALGVSDDAAQKRVSRAVERLREFLSKRGVTVGASGLVVIISANAIQAAPVGLTVTISTAAGLAGTTIAATATATIIKTIAMTTLQKTLITAALVTIVSAGIYEVRQNLYKKTEYIPRESWKFAGFATPEAAIQSYMWAKSRGDVESAFAVATPELKQETMDRYFKGKSDEEISALLISSAKNQTGVQILKKTTVADDQVILQVHMVGTPKKFYSTLTMKKIDGVWKISGTDEGADQRR